MSTPTDTRAIGMNRLLEILERSSRSFRCDIYRAISFVLVLALMFPAASWTQQPDGSKMHAATSHSLSNDNKEDWTSLPIGSSGLHAERPVFGEKDESALFTRELIQVQWRQGDSIDLYVIKPKGVTNPVVILYLYGYPTETNRFRDDSYCQRVTSGGFAAVGFVSALTGHRYRNRPMKEWFVSDLQEALGSSVHDVQMILNYLSTRGDLDMDRIGMFGEGSGGTIAILATATDPRIKAVDVLDPWGDWPDWAAKSAIIPEEERAEYQKLSFLKGLEPLDPVRGLPRLKSQQVRIQSILDDDITPQDAKAKIELAAPNTTLILHYPDTKEFYRAASAGRMFQWTKDQLRPVLSSRPAEDKKEGAKAVGLTTSGDRNQ
jgi:hypothetical protein